MSNVALLDHREDSTNILTHDPIGSHLVNAAVHERPEVAVIIRASSLPGITEWLARETSREDVDLAPPFAEIGSGDVFITFCVWKPILKHGAAKWVDLAVEQVLPSQHRSRHFGATYAAEY